MSTCLRHLQHIGLSSCHSSLVSRLTELKASHLPRHLRKTRKSSQWLPRPSLSHPIGPNWVNMPPSNPTAGKGIGFSQSVSPVVRVRSGVWDYCPTPLGEKWILSQVELCLGEGGENGFCVQDWDPHIL